MCSVTVKNYESRQYKSTHTHTHTHPRFHTLLSITVASVRDRLVYLNKANSIETRWNDDKFVFVFYAKLIFIIQWNYIVLNIIL